MDCPQTYSPDECAGAARAAALRAVPDFDLIEARAIQLARENFWAYRRLMRPRMKLGWFQRDMARRLQRYYNRLIAKERPKLLLESPPQHGKSETIVDFNAWLAGKNPDLRSIYASYSDDLGTRANLWMQRQMTTPRYAQIFPDLIFPNVDGVRIGGSLYRCNTTIIEYVKRLGSFRNTTVRGKINGEGLDQGNLDDVMKGREEANSQVIRDKTWDWFTDDWFARFSDEAGFLGIGTCWHIDDPLSRLKAKFGDAIEVVKYPAISRVLPDGTRVACSENDEGAEALFPELKPMDFLLERKRLMAPHNWEAVYQQNPQPVGGNVIKSGWYQRYRELPVLRRRIMYADTAQKTKEANDWSVFEVWGEAEDGRHIFLIDVLRGKWTAPELKRRAVDFWNKHKAYDEVIFGALQEMKVEDKVSGTGLIQEIAAACSIPIIGIERHKDKWTRLEDVLGYIHAGRVAIPEEAPWVSDFLTESEAMTADDSHAHDDQIDPMIDAIGDMLGGQSSVRIWESVL